MMTTIRFRRSPIESAVRLLGVAGVLAALPVVALLFLAGRIGRGTVAFVRRLGRQVQEDLWSGTDPTPTPR